MNGAAIPANTITRAQALQELQRWEQMKQALAKLQASERVLRDVLFKHFFPAPVEGTNTAELNAGWKVKGKYPIDRKPDPVRVEAIKATTVAQLSPEQRKLLYVPDDAPPNALVVEVLRLNVDALLVNKPELSTRNYRQLTEQQRHYFDQCLDIKPGSASLEIAAPSATAQAAQAAQGTLGGVAPESA